MDIGACIKDSWEALKRYPVPILVGSLVILIINGVAQSLLTSHATGGIAIMALKAFKGEEPEIGDVFKPFERFVDYLLVFLVTLSGIFLCLVGVLLTSFIFMFAPMILAAEGSDWRTALTKSKELVMGNLGDAILLLLVIIAINMVGVLLCGIGILVTVPLTYLILTRAYQQVTGTVE